jgi:hypothetical protein
VSADKWTTCPKCGAVDELREDYEIGIYENCFEVNFGAKCQKCDFDFSFKCKSDITKPAIENEGYIREIGAMKETIRKMREALGEVK